MNFIVLSDVETVPNIRKERLVLDRRNLSDA